MNRFVQRFCPFFLQRSPFLFSFRLFRRVLKLKKSCLLDAVSTRDSSPEIDAEETVCVDLRE